MNWILPFRNNRGKNETKSKKEDKFSNKIYSADFNYNLCDFYVCQFYA